MYMYMNAVCTSVCAWWYEKAYVGVSVCKQVRMFANVPVCGHRQLTEDTHPVCHLPRQLSRSLASDPLPELC